MAEIDPLDIKGSKWRIRATHFAGDISGKINYRYPKFTHFGDLPPRKDVFRALAHLHPYDDEVRFPNRDILSELMAMEPKPIDQSLERLVQAIGGEIYWPCCWAGMVGRIWVVIGTGPATVVSLMNVETMATIEGMMDPDLLKEAMDLVVRVGQLRHFYVLFVGGRLRIYQDNSRFVEVDSLKAVESFIDLS